MSLTPVERQAERDYSSALLEGGDKQRLGQLLADATRGLSRDPKNRDDWLPDRSWYPLLPTTLPRCEICTLPNRKGRCKGCKTLENCFGWPFASLEFLCIADKRGTPEHLIYAWKDYAMNWPGDVDDAWLSTVGIALSAYLTWRSIAGA